VVVFSEKCRNNGNTQGIQGTVSVGGPSVFTQLTVDDSNDTTPHSSVLVTNSSLQGLMPGVIEFDQNSIDSLTILDGTGGTVYGVESTPNQPDFFARTTTTLINQGLDTVQVGDSNATTAGIQGNLTIADPRGSTLLSVDDSNDHTTGETVTMTSTTLTGLTAGTINYGAAVLQDLAVFTGNGGTTFNVLSTPTVVVNGSVTELESRGQDSVNVGNAGSVQAIEGSLDVVNVGGATVLNVDDSADGTTRVVTLQNAGPHNSLPEITGLAPGTIAYLGVSQLNVTTGTNFNIVGVEGTSASTLLTTQANDLVEVGDAGSTQGIRSSLFVRNVRAGKTGLIVDDSADTTSRTVQLSYLDLFPGVSLGRLTGLSPATISFPGRGIASIQLHTGDGANTVNVLKTKVLTELEQNGGTESINVGFGGRVQGLLGDLTIGSEFGFATPVIGLNVDDSADPGGRAVTFDGTAFGSISGLARGQISYLSKVVRSITVDGGSGGNIFDVHATPAGTAVTLNTGAGSDTVSVGNTSNTLDLIQGPVTINGQAGVNQLIINDAGSTKGHTYTLTSTKVKRSGAATISYGAIQKLTIDAGTGTNTFIVSSSPSGATVALNGGAGANTLVTNNGGHTIRIISHNAGSYDNITFSNVASLVGGTGTNVFAFTPAGVLDGTIHGGGGSDWLDYSAFTAGVTVNLVTGSATGVHGGAAGGVTGIRNVRGGAGDDTLIGGGGNILVGGGGDDTLVDKFSGSAASGRSLLIGGGGGNRLTAGSASDILIGGTTIFDDNDAALAAILAEWQSSDSYNTRFDRLEGLQSGGLNGSNHLIFGTTVKNDGAADVLNGGAGFDWYFARLSGGVVDTINGRNKPGHEHVNNTI
jgi:acrosin